MLLTKPLLLNAVHKRSVKYAQTQRHGHTAQDVDGVGVSEDDEFSPLLRRPTRPAPFCYGIFGSQGEIGGSAGHGDHGEEVSICLMVMH